VTLPLDVSRCAGRYSFLKTDYCPERHTCERHLAWIERDAEAGIQNYKGIPISMAVRGCTDKIEVSENAD